MNSYELMRVHMHPWDRGAIKCPSPPLGPKIRGSASKTIMNVAKLVLISVKSIFGTFHDQFIFIHFPAERDTPCACPTPLARGCAVPTTSYYPEPPPGPKYAEASMIDFIIEVVLL
jgi:hypothetical protein